MQDKYTLIDSQGNIIVQYDNRTVSQTVQQQIAMIKYACQQAIEATGVGWMAEREISGGKPIPQDIKDLCQQYRTLSDQLEDQVNQTAATAVDDNDHAVCDLIQQIMWPAQPESQ